MVVHLYVDHLSQPARALMLFVRTNEIPTEEHTISIRAGNQSNPTNGFSLYILRNFN